MRFRSLDMSGCGPIISIVITSDSITITNLGREVVTVGRDRYGSRTAALQTLRSLFRKSTLFVEEIPSWTDIAQKVMLNQPGIARLIDLMQEIHADRNDDIFPLPVLVQEIYHRNSDFAKECFIAINERDRLQRFDLESRGSDSTPATLWERQLYRTSTVHQFKSMLCHSGILTTKGRERANLEFSTDCDKFMWALTPEFRESTGESPVEVIQKGERPDIEEQTRDMVSPSRTETTTSRIIRNTPLVKALKAEYDYHCQVCRDRRKRSSNKYYAEGHHLHPLGENGPDRRENIVIVCPTCHADLDYGMMFIDPDTLTIDHNYDESVDGSVLDVKKSHTIGRMHLEYHNKKIFE